MVKRVTVRLRSRFYRDLKRLAHQQGRSLAGLIRDHLEAVVTQAEASARTSSPQDVITTAGTAEAPPRP
jgi:predicted DNA-binding protein